MVEIRRAALGVRRLRKRGAPVPPAHLAPLGGAADKILKARTLTNLYNERPIWLADAHRDLAAAVAAGTARGPCYVRLPVLLARSAMVFFRAFGMGQN